MFYEAHITVFGPEQIPARDLTKFMDLSLKLGGKTLIIQLLGIPNEIFHPVQVMFGRKVELWSDGEALNWINYLGDQFIKEGFVPSRIKLEAALSKGSAQYYEAHWKVTKPFASAESCYISQSVLDRKRFWATSRLTRGTMTETNARIQFERVQASLKSNSLFLEGDHFERVILDTTPDLDKGWAF